jgi:catechol 2,3-dioxygenase-like lactoylglutathione lyase family enzyme
MNLETLDHVGLPVADMERSTEWYQTVLGLQRAYEEVWDSYPAVLLAGDSGVALFPARGAPVPASTFDSLPHVGFRVGNDDYEAALHEIQAAGLEYREADHDAAKSIYLLDPDSHLIEITAYVTAGS